MKTISKTNLLTLLFFLTPINGFAAGPGWIHNVDVYRVVIVVNGGVNVRVSPDLDGCTSQSGYGLKYASVYPDHLGLDKIYSGLLAAQLSGKKISIYLADDTCKVGEVVIGGQY